MPARVSQQILMILQINWKSFLVANEVYKENPSKLRTVPRFPGYKKQIITRINIVIYTKQAISKRQLKQGIINPGQTGIYLKTIIPTLQIKQVLLLPRINYNPHFALHIVAQEFTKKVYLTKQNYL